VVLGANAPSKALARLEHLDLDPALCEHPGGFEPRKTCSEDCDLHHATGCKARAPTIEDSLSADRGQRFRFAGFFAAGFFDGFFTGGFAAINAWLSPTHAVRSPSLGGAARSIFVQPAARLSRASFTPTNRNAFLFAL
jgi:hypothetical protein